MMFASFFLAAAAALSFTPSLALRAECWSL
jgi:hypothetical protein